MEPPKNGNGVDREGALKLQMYARRMSEVARTKLEELRDRVPRHPPTEERALMDTWRRTTLQWAGFAGICAFFAARIPPWPLSTLASSAFGTLTAGIVGTFAAIREAPAVLAGLIDLKSESDIVDRALCPALLELQGCIDDDKCNAALRAVTSASRDANSVLDLLKRCRRRRARSTDTEFKPDLWYHAGNNDPAATFDFPPPPTPSNADEFD